MLKLNQKCKICIHEEVCDLKVQRAYYDNTVLGFYEGFEGEFGENFDLVLKCNHFYEGTKNGGAGHACPADRFIADQACYKNTTVMD